MIKPELIKSENTIFSNSVIIIFAKTGPTDDPMETPSICLYTCQSLLNLLTHNDYSVKDTFEAVKKIRSILPELFEQGYRYYSLDVVSLFTNVPLNKTIKIILKRVYEEKLLATKLRKSTLKKLIKDTCMKTAFSYNNKLYKQIDGVSMGSSLGPVLANIIMTENSGF